MKTNTFFKFLLVIALFAFANQVEAQSFLKKLNKAVDKGLSAVDKGLNAAETGINVADAIVNAEPDTTAQAERKIYWDSIPVYSMVRVNEVDTVGNPVLNEDGTQKFRVFLKDQFGNIRSAEAVKAQQKKLNEAVLAITGKVAIGGIAGGVLKGDLKGAAAGAAVGALTSAEDIEMAIRQKKSLQQQKKLLEVYKNKFNEEGYPKDAKVDLSKYKDFGLTEENTLSKSTEDIKTLCKGESFNTTDDSAWDF